MPDNPFPSNKPYSNPFAPPESSPAQEKTMMDLLSIILPQEDMDKNKPGSMSDLSMNPKTLASNDAARRAESSLLLQSQSDPDRMNQTIDKLDMMENWLAARRGNMQNQLESDMNTELWAKAGGVAMGVIGAAVGAPWLLMAGGALNRYADDRLKGWQENYSAETKGFMEAFMQEQQALQDRLNSAIGHLGMMARSTKMPVKEAGESDEVYAKRVQAYQEELGKMAEVVIKLDGLPRESGETLKQMAPYLANATTEEQMRLMMDEIRLMNERMNLVFTQRGMQRDEDVFEIQNRQLASEEYKDAIEKGATQDQAIKATEDALKMRAKMQDNLAVDDAQIKDLARSVAGYSVETPTSYDEKKKLPEEVRKSAIDPWAAFASSLTGMVDRSPEAMKQQRVLNPSYKKIPPFKNMGEKASLVELTDAIAEYVDEYGAYKDVPGLGRTLTIPSKFQYSLVDAPSGRFMSRKMQKVEHKDFIPVFATPYAPANKNIWIKNIYEVSSEGRTAFHEDFLRQVETWLRGATLNAESATQ